jgi:hypothetical protein
MAQISGSKMVAAAVTLTLTAVGVGTIYLPFFADKDRLRGLSEEGDMRAAEKAEYERALREMGQASPPEDNQRRSVPTSNSMWTRINKQASPGNQK